MARCFPRFPLAQNGIKYRLQRCGWIVDWFPINLVRFGSVPLPFESSGTRTKIDPSKQDPLFCSNYLQGFLKFLQGGLNSGHCFGAFCRIFRKQVLLAARPDLVAFGIVRLRRDDDADRILIDTIFDNTGIRKDPL